MEHIIFLGLNLPAWITLLTLLGIFITMARTHMPTEVVFLGAVTLLLVSGIISEEEVMSGFGSEPVVVHAAFFIIIAGLIHTGALHWLTKNLLGIPSTFKNALFRLMLPIGGLSALLGSVNVTALFIDMVKLWTHKLNISPSRLLLPLSYAATFGGMCTLLGSTSNLVIAGLWANKTGNSLDIFAPLLPGAIVGVVGILLVIALRRWIPDRVSPETSFETTSDYTVELLVPTENEAVGLTVAESGLKNVRGGSLIEIVRFDKEIISPVPDDEFILGGDRLIFAGQINEILELKRTHQLVAADHHVFSINEIDSNRKLRTAYIPFGSELIGTRMSQSDFEKKTDIVLVAVAREGKRVNGQPREIQLAAGDTLLLECPGKTDPEDLLSSRRTLTFFDSHFVPQISRKTILSVAILIVMFLLSLFHVLPLVAVTMLAAGVMMLTKCCRMEQIAKYIEWDLLMVLGATVVLSIAITKTNIADLIATHTLDIVGTNPHIIMAVLCLGAALLSELVGAVGAGAVFFPIVGHAADTIGCNPMPFVIALMLSVATGLSSPMGSTTHMLIYGPGGFRFTDFFRLGLPIHLLLLLTIQIVIHLIYPL